MKPAINLPNASKLRLPAAAAFLLPPRMNALMRINSNEIH